MTNHAQAPATGTENATPYPNNDNLPQHLCRILHLTLEQHNAYVALQGLISVHGFHEVLDDPALICLVLRCTATHWHDDIAPAIVPILENDQEQAA